MEEPPDPTRLFRFALPAGLLLVGASILLVDRAASTWSHDHLHRPAVLDWPTHLVDPMRWGSALTLIGLGLAAGLRGWRPGRGGRTAIAACLAILVAYEIKEGMKALFGRTWPETWVDGNPSWIRDHAYGFHLLHGGTGWESFPSGHTAQAAALATVLWLRAPRLRAAAVALVVLVAGGLWGSDYHFVGDILAGGLLGAACGIGIEALVCRD